MQFQVKGRNLEVSDAIRSYAEEKAGATRDFNGAVYTFLRRYAA